jgi:hypothetical protein
MGQFIQSRGKKVKRTFVVFHFFETRIQKSHTSHVPRGFYIDMKASDRQTHTIILLHRLFHWLRASKRVVWETKSQLEASFSSCSIRMVSYPAG